MYYSSPATTCRCRGRSKPRSGPTCGRSSATSSSTVWLHVSAKKRPATGWSSESLRGAPRRVISYALRRTDAEGRFAFAHLASGLYALLTFQEAQPAPSMQQVVVVRAAVELAIICAFIIVFTRRFVRRPIHRLIASTHEISNMNLDAPIQAGKGSGEVADLVDGDRCLPALRLVALLQLELLADDADQIVRLGNDYSKGIIAFARRSTSAWSRSSALPTSRAALRPR